MRFKEVKHWPKVTQLVNARAEIRTQAARDCTLYPA